MKAGIKQTILGNNLYLIKVIDFEHSRHILNHESGTSGFGVWGLGFGV